MTDFVRDLEAELLAAARRRAARRRWFPRLSPRPLLAATALLLAVVTVLALLPRQGQERPAVPVGDGFRVPAAQNITACASSAEPVMRPEQTAPRADLELFTRPQRARDRIAPATLLPVGATPRGARRPALSLDLVAVQVTDLRDVTPACGRGPSRGPGTCLLRGQAVACFTSTEIHAGRAFALTGTTLIGLVPDGVTSVGLGAGRVPGRVAVRENTVEAQVQNLRPGDELAAEFDRTPYDVFVLNRTGSDQRGLSEVRRIESLGLVVAVTSVDQRSRATRVQPMTPEAQGIADTVGQLLEVQPVPAAGTKSRPPHPFAIAVLGEDRMR